MADRGVQLQLQTERVLKKFVKERSYYSVQEQFATHDEAEFEAESPPLLSPDPTTGPRSLVPQVLSNTGQAQNALETLISSQLATDSDDEVVAHVVSRLNILAMKIEEKCTQGDSSLHFNLIRIRSLLYGGGQCLSWETVAELFIAVFNTLRHHARQDPTTDLSQVQEIVEIVEAVVHVVSEWVFKNGGWWSFLFLSDPRSHCNSPVAAHTSIDHQPPSAQTNSKGTVSIRQHQLATTAAAAVGGVISRRSRDALGAPLFAGAKRAPRRTTPLGTVISCVELTHRTPPGSPLHPRWRACSDPNLPPLSHCPVKYIMGLAKELFEIVCETL